MGWTHSICMTLYIILWSLSICGCESSASQYSEFLSLGLSFPFPFFPNASLNKEKVRSITNADVIIYVLTPIGQLNAVDHLKVTSSPTSTPIQLRWTQPFSLDLNDTNPDVIYCIDIYEVTDIGLQRDLHIPVVSDCSVIRPQYSFTPANSNSLFQFVVTPRSNVPGAKNGTANEIYLYNSE